MYFDWLHITLHLPVNQVLRFKVRDFLIFLNIFRLSNKNVCVEKKIFWQYFSCEEKTTRKSNFDRNLTSLDRVDHCYGLKMRGINYIIPLSVHTSVFMEMLWYTKTEGKI